MRCQPSTSGHMCWALAEKSRNDQSRRPSPHGCLALGRSNAIGLSNGNLLPCPRATQVCGHTGRAIRSEASATFGRDLLWTERDGTAPAGAVVETSVTSFAFLPSVVAPRAGLRPSTHPSETGPYRRLRYCNGAVDQPPASTASAHCRGDGSQISASMNRCGRS